MNNAVNASSFKIYQSIPVKLKTDIINCFLKKKVKKNSYALAVISIFK
jgi:hypothetical protein